MARAILDLLPDGRPVGPTPKAKGREEKELLKLPKAFRYL